MKRRETVLFTDLEGTILREADGKFSQEDMFELLAAVSEFEGLTNSKVQMHIVSPVYVSQMEEVMNEIDKCICRFNKTNGKSLDYIKQGAAEQDIEDFRDCDSASFIRRMCKSHDSRIVYFQDSPYMKYNGNVGYGKEKYVRQVLEEYQNNERTELVAAIYAGNGRNDVDAVRLLRAIGTKRGLERTKPFVICPTNSRSLLQNYADYVSDKEDLQGIADGVMTINKKIIEKLELRAEKSETQKIEKKTDKEQIDI